jgi:hypothetical protein
VNAELTHGFGGTIYLRRGGHVHAAQDDGRGAYPRYGWCGIRAQFRHAVNTAGVRSEVTCTKCLAALKADQPRAWRSGR